MSIGAQNIKKVEQALKYNYLPAFENQINTKASPFFAKIKRVPLKNNTIVATAPVGLSGGFGYGSEGMATPKAGPQKYEGFKLSAADMYVNVCISQKAAKLGGGSGSMVDILDGEIKGAYEAAKWNVARSVFGNGTGVLASCSSVSTDGTMTGASNISNIKNVIEGLIIDVYKSDDSSKVGTARIKSVDRVNKTITFWEPINLLSGVECFLTVQNSYNNEITGIGAIFDDDVDEIYGVKKSENLFIKPVIKDAEGDISDSIIRSALREASEIKNNDVDMLLCGYAAYDAYAEYLRVNNISVVDKVIAGGFKAINFRLDNREIDLVTERFVPDNEMWGVNTDSFKFHCTDWEFAELQGGGIFNLMENESVYRALLANYGNLMCDNPGGCVRIHNVGYAVA